MGQSFQYIPQAHNFLRIQPKLDPLILNICFSCSPPDLNFLVTYICVHVK